MEDFTTTAEAASPAETQDSAPRKSIQKLSESFCAPQYAASLKCLDDSDYDKSKCQDHFEAYKACRKQEIRKITLRGSFSNAVGGRLLTQDHPCQDGYFPKKFDVAECFL